MQDERDIINDMKPIRSHIPPARYFHDLAEVVKNDDQLTRKRGYRMLVNAVASLVAGWLLIVWLLPNTESRHIKATLLKTEVMTSPHFNKNQKQDFKTLSAKPQKKKKGVVMVQNIASEPELDLSSLSEEDFLTYLDEEEIDLMELEEFVNNNN
jgi:hypothetical protein